MKKIIPLVLTLLFGTLTCPAQDDGILRSRLSRDTILIGDQIEWTLDLSLAPGEQAMISKPGESPIPGVESLSEMAFDTVKDVPIDTATFVIHDIKGQIRYPVTFREVLPWIGLALLIAAAIWAVIRWIRFRRQNRDFFGKPVVKDPPHIVALRSLEKTRSQKLWQAGKQKQFYTQVTDALRQYIADRYEVSALEQTSAEMFRDLEDKDIDPALREKMKDLFTTADFVKFAKHTATDQENENAIPTAIRFVNETYVQQLEKEEEE